MDREIKITIEGVAGSGKSALYFAIAEMLSDKYKINVILHNPEDFLPLAKIRQEKILNKIGKDMKIYLYEETSRKK